MNSIELETVNEKDFQSTIDTLLIDIKDIFDYFFTNVSVNVKTLEANDDDVFLTTLSRAPLEERTHEEIFDVYGYDTIQKLKEIYPLDKSKQSDNLCINSAYIDVLFNAKEAWICNDLIFAEEVNHFYSTSSDWWDHYNSLVIFPITDKNFNTDSNEEYDFIGLLIIDTLEDYGFEPQLTKQIGGYFAHRLYQVLVYLKQDDVDLNSN